MQQQQQQPPCGGIQVLPQVPAKPKQQTDTLVQVKSFTCSLNDRADQKNKIVNIFNKVDLTIEPNKSLMANIEYRNTYNIVPYVNYNLLCPDSEFGLSHYISEITEKSFTVMISNKINAVRKVSVIYQVKQL